MMFLFNEKGNQSLISIDKLKSIYARVYVVFVFLIEMMTLNTIFNPYNDIKRILKASIDFWLEMNTKALLIKLIFFSIDMYSNLYCFIQLAIRDNEWKSLITSRLIWN